MGNNIIEKITPEILKIENLIYQNDYKNSFITYSKAKEKILNLEDEEMINNLTNYLLVNCIEEKNHLKFKTLIANLRNKDKIPYLFQLIYENKLVDSIEKIQTNENIIINQKSSKDKSKDTATTKKEIELKMLKIIEINKYIEMCYFRSILFEMIAEKYFNLGTVNYSLFTQKKEQKSSDLIEIINLFEQCVDNYNKTGNQKKKLIYYNNSLEKINAHYNILLGFEKITEEKFDEALQFFNKVKYNNSSIIEEKNKGTYICYENLGKIEEEKENYGKAIEYYSKIEKNEKVFELNILLCEKKIIECIKAKKYNESFDYFTKIFQSFNEANNFEYYEIKYTDIKVILIELIIKLSLISYRNNTLKDYIELIQDLKNKINHKEMETKFEELLSELTIMQIKEEDGDLFNYVKSSVISPESSEIQKRLYLSILIINYLESNQKDDILLILLNNGINLGYLNHESFGILKNYLKKEITLNKLYLISKIFYKIVIIFGLFNNIDCLNTIGVKILEVLKMPNLQEEVKYNDILEYLLLSFQEILINNKNIKSYNNYKNIFFSVIIKYNKFLNCITRGLLFLSKKKVIFEKGLLDILKAYLLKNVDGNLLETLFIQCELQPNILTENIDFIYKIQLNYQRNKIAGQNVDKIFNFLLSLPEDIISSNTSIINLENYLNEMNINPLCYKLIKKIPIKKRGLLLAQKLANYNDKGFGNNQMSNDYFKSHLNFQVSIQKEELKEIENRLNDKEIIEKLIYFLKKQKELFKYLNIEKISEYYSLSTKELFNLIIENEVYFNEKSLINLLNGFYKNNENEIKETFHIFNKIRSYQNKFSELIELNLKVELFLYNKEYLKINSFNLFLNEIFKNFHYLCGFSYQHRAFILYILGLPNNNIKKLIAKEMIFFLVKKNYDIGIDIFKKILNQMNTDELLIEIQNILIDKKITHIIKESTLMYLYEIISKEENKLKIIKLFKYFIDWIIIPDELLKYFINLIKSYKNDEIYNEIIFFLGNYFSIQKTTQDKYLNEIISIIQYNNIYKNLLKYSKSYKKNEIFYLYSCLNYIQFPLNMLNEDIIKTIPTNIIIDYIIKKNENLNKNKKILWNNITYLNNYWKFEEFCPKRDQILRKLFLNNKENDVNSLKLICC